MRALMAADKAAAGAQVPGANVSIDPPLPLVVDLCFVHPGGLACLAVYIG